MVLPFVSLASYSAPSQGNDSNSRNADMTTIAGVGQSSHRNPVRAGQEAVELARKNAGFGADETCDFVVLFATVGYPQEAIVQSVRDATGGATLWGCSVEGTIAGKDANESNFSVSLLAVKSDEMTMKVAMAEGAKEDSLRCGRRIGEALRPGDDSDGLALFVAADGLTANFDRVIEGLENGLAIERHLPMIGGASADNWEMKTTYQYCDDKVFTDGVSCALLSGPGRVSCLVNHGCVPIGTKRKITRAEGNVIYEIDNRRAVDVFHEYITEDELDNWAKATVNLCLAFEAPKAMQSAYDQYVIRYTPLKDDEVGSITLPAEVETGADVWMARRDKDKIAAGVERLRDALLDRLGGRTPTFVLQIDCAGRGKVVLRDSEKSEILASAQAGFPAETRWFGCYVYGEIGPVTGRNYFHNFTTVVLVVH